MSADNYLGIYRCKNGKFLAYSMCASENYKKKGLGRYLKQHCCTIFEAKDVEDAVMKAELETRENYYEYGYSFLNLRLKGYSYKEEK